MEFNRYNSIIESKVKVKAKNSTNQEIKKVFKVLRNLNGDRIELSITNDENIFTVWVKDLEYQLPGRGTFYTGMTKQDHQKSIKKVKLMAKNVYMVLKNSKVDFEDIWENDDNVGGILADY